ncbi:MAG TPA: hypothetical protein VGB75_08835 [Jatrophihabitans sp.]|jgi:hypothetical protein|uniref:hypothetical protein n=1 Tax=Jatrophihabitans sp. TaxID=1932789 RepID=UPI002F161DB9
MGLHFTELDDATRRYMVAEFDADLISGDLYNSVWFTDRARIDYPELCRIALTSGTDDSLTTVLSVPGMFVTDYQKRKPKGGFTTASVPFTAPATFAEGEFGRFYLRGLCLRLLDEGTDQVEIYRAKQVANPRSASNLLIGTAVDPTALLADLRTSTGIDTALGLPPGPNSGLSGMRRQ